MFSFLSTDVFAQTYYLANGSLVGYKFNIDFKNAWEDTYGNTKFPEAPGNYQHVELFEDRGGYYWARTNGLGAQYRGSIKRVTFDLADLLDKKLADNGINPVSSENTDPINPSHYAQLGELGAERIVNERIRETNPNARWIRVTPENSFISGGLDVVTVISITFEKENDLTNQIPFLVDESKRRYVRGSWALGVLAAKKRIDYENGHLAGIKIKEFEDRMKYFKDAFLENEITIDPSVNMINLFKHHSRDGYIDYSELNDFGGEGYLFGILVYPESLCGLCDVDPLSFVEVKLYYLPSYRSYNSNYAEFQRPRFGQREKDDDEYVADEVILRDSGLILGVSYGLRLAFDDQKQSPQYSLSLGYKSSDGWGLKLKGFYSEVNNASTFVPGKLLYPYEGWGTLHEHGYRNGISALVFSELFSLPVYIGVGGGIEWENLTTSDENIKHIPTGKIIHNEFTKYSERGLYEAELGFYLNSRRSIALVFSGQTPKLFETKIEDLRFSAGVDIVW